MGYAELFIHVASPDPAHDVFSDPSPDLDPISRNSHNFLSNFQDQDTKRRIAAAFEEHAAYATEIFARQPRTAVYSVLMAGSRARLLRWDRAGCIVTEAFDIRTCPAILCEFLWRFARETNYGRGHDPSVRRASAVEEGIFRKAITEHIRAELGPGEDLHTSVALHYAPRRVFAALILQQCFDPKSKNSRRFLFSLPVMTPGSLVANRSQDYWAVDAVRRRVVFLKDTWRPDPMRELEGALLKRLCAAGVPYVPSLVWQGEIPCSFPKPMRKLLGKCCSCRVKRLLKYGAENDIQSTKTNELYFAHWACHVAGKKARVLQRQHYRLVVSPVGHPLATVRGAEELLHATHNIFTGMLLISL